MLKKTLAKQHLLQNSSNCRRHSCTSYEHFWELLLIDLQNNYWSLVLLGHFVVDSFNLDSGILETFACGIQNLGNFSCGIQNPGLWKLEFSSRNLESRTILDYLTRGDLIQKPMSQCRAEASMRITWPPLIPHIQRKKISLRKELHLWQYYSR